MSTLTTEVCKEAGVNSRDAERYKNYFALGLVSWLYSRPIESTLKYLSTQRFAPKTPLVMEAHLSAPFAPGTTLVKPPNSLTRATKSRRRRSHRASTYSDG